MLKNKKSLAGIVFLGAFLLLTVLVRFCDVKAIGPENSSVGFATINGAVSSFLGYNETLFRISDLIGYLAIAVCGCFGLLGFIQLLQGKSLKKVDPHILMLGIFYIIVILLYVLFNKVVINYRPVLTDGVLEASYPSSHTILSVCVFASAIYMLRFLWKGTKSQLKTMQIVLAVLLITLVLTRFLSGVHWLTDIIGSLLLSASLLSFLVYAKERLIREKKTAKKLR